MAVDDQRCGSVPLGAADPESANKSPKRVACRTSSLPGCRSSGSRKACAELAVGTGGQRAWLTVRHRQVKNILKFTDNPTSRGSRVEWEILLTGEVEAFLDELYESDPASHQLVNQAILVLERNGPGEGRPLVDTVTASRIANMKELRPPSAGRSEIRILLVFDPWRSVVLLVAGDKSGQWDKWYRAAIPRAEQLYDDYLAKRRKEMGS